MNHHSSITKEELELKLLEEERGFWAATLSPDEYQFIQPSEGKRFSTVVVLSGAAIALGSVVGLVELELFLLAIVLLVAGLFAGEPVDRLGNYVTKYAAALVQNKRINRNEVKLPKEIEEIEELAAQLESQIELYLTPSKALKVVISPPTPSGLSNYINHE